MNKNLAISTLGLFGLLLGACSKPAPEADDAANEPAAAIEQAPSMLADMPSGQYDMDATHAYVTFSYLHLGFSNPHVGFSEFDISLNLDSGNPMGSSLSMTINAESVYSRVEKFDEHLRGEKFFDTANFPEIRFAANDIKMDGAEFSVTGDLTIKGVTKPATVKGKINKAAMHPMSKKPTLGISAEANVNRSDWGLDAAIPAVGDEVVIYIEAELSRSAE